MPSVELLQLVLHGGIPALSLIILYLFAKHHLKVIDQHREDDKRCDEKLRQIEEDFRAKLEEVYKGELKLVESVTEALSESTKALEAVRKDINK